jgi:hypothetical protein
MPRYSICQGRNHRSPEHGVLELPHHCPDAFLRRVRCIGRRSRGDPSAPDSRQERECDGPHRGRRGRPRPALLVFHGSGGEAACELCSSARQQRFGQPIWCARGSNPLCNCRDAWTKTVSSATTAILRRPETSVASVCSASHLAGPSPLPAPAIATSERTLYAHCSSCMEAPTKRSR